MRTLFEHIPEYIINVIETLYDGGFEAYLVGGCVRDEALGRVPDDYDITTNARPSEMLELFCNYRVIETGIQHGTLTVISDGKPVEITTYRIDGKYDDNRHPNCVEFTDKITCDLSRRDFTVNAMAYSPMNGLVDPFGGMKHLKERKISCVGEPEKRFKEDGLRILRALRFASTLDFNIDMNTSKALIKLCDLLDGISKERIYTELNKLICGIGASKIFKEFKQVLCKCIEDTDEIAFEKSAEYLNDFPNDSLMRFALIFRLSENISPDNLTSSDDLNSHPDMYKYINASGLALRKLKAPLADIRRVRLSTELLFTPFPKTDSDIKRLMGRFDDRCIEYYRSAMRTLGYPGYESFSKRYEFIKNLNPCVRISDLKINGHDIMDETALTGKAVGNMLEYLLDLVISDKLPNDRNILLQEAAQSASNENE